MHVIHEREKDGFWGVDHEILPNSCSPTTRFSQWVWFLGALYYYRPADMHRPDIKNSDMMGRFMCGTLSNPRSKTQDQFVDYPSVDGMILLYIRCGLHLA